MNQTLNTVKALPYAAAAIVTSVAAFGVVAASIPVIGCCAATASAATWTATKASAASTGLSQKVCKCYGYLQGCRVRQLEAVARLRRAPVSDFSTACVGEPELQPVT